MKIENGKKDMKKDDSYDYYPEASRFTLAILLATLLIWGIYDSFKTGNYGFQWYLVQEILICMMIFRYYFKIKDSRKNKK